MNNFIFLGTSSNLIGGIKLDEGSILAANSLVTRDILSKSFYKLNKLYKSKFFIKNL